MSRTPGAGIATECFVGLDHPKLLLFEIQENWTKLYAQSWTRRPPHKRVPQRPSLAKKNFSKRVVAANEARPRCREESDRLADEHHVGSARSSWRKNSAVASHMLPKAGFWEAAPRADLYNSLIALARPERFELPTPRFVVLCSLAHLRVVTLLMDWTSAGDLFFP